MNIFWNAARSDTWRSAVLSASGIGTADHEDGIYCTECQQSGLSAAGTFHGGYPEYHGTGVISLLQQIIDYSNYDVVILDLSDSVSQLYKVLEQCTRIYMPIRADPVSQAKIHQFEHTLQVWEKQMVLDRIRKIKLPYHRSSKTGIGYMDDLVWSELGDYVREMLRTEREDG